MPGAGVLALAGKQVAPKTVEVPAASTVALKVKAKGKGKKKLKRRGRLKAKLTVTFTPTGGVAKAQPKTVKLKRKG